MPEEQPAIMEMEPVSAITGRMAVADAVTFDVSKSCPNQDARFLVLAAGEEGERPFR